MTALPARRWLYRAKWLRTIDGDTIDAELDMGFHVYRLERLRLLGLDAPEAQRPTREAGDAATAYVGAWLNAATSLGDEWPLLVETYQSDVFGRFLATVWRVTDGRNLNADLLAAGHAAPRP